MGWGESRVAIGGEATCLIGAFFIVPAALAYCYVLPSWTCAGKWRLLATLPVVVILVVLPFSFSSVHLRAISAFFLSWIAIFRLLLFSFGRGPLLAAVASNPSSFPAFVAVTALPIKIRQKPSPPPARGAPPSMLTLLGAAAKGLLLALIISFYSQRRRLHRGIVLTLYFAHMYLALDMVLAATAAASRALLPAGTDLEPQFAAPYLSTSLQDFWGRRWNLIVSDVLRDAVYTPVRAGWGTTAGVVATFLTSGLMHEAMFCYLTLKPPTGEVGSFFVLHGACLAAEIAAKKWWRRRGLRPLHRALAAPLTVAFLVATGMWLFLPQITRSGAEEMVVAESEAVVAMLWRAVGGGR